jgi:hypothetical protein
MAMRIKNNTERQLGISSADATMLVRLFMRVYQLGVNDAYEVDDSGRVRQWIDYCSQPGVFGRITDDTSHDVVYWQLVLQREIIAMNCYNRFLAYIRRAGKYGRNYLSVLWPVCQSFYNLGLVEYNDEPGLLDMQVFNSDLHLRWAKRPYHQWRKLDVVCMAQDYCFKLRRRDTDAGVSHVTLLPRHYEAFIKAIGIASVVRFDSMT